MKFSKLVRKIYNRIIFRETFKAIAETISETYCIPYKEAKHILRHSYLMSLVDEADKDMIYYIWHYDCDYWAKEVMDAYHLYNGEV